MEHGRLHKYIDGKKVDFYPETSTDDVVLASDESITLTIVLEELGNSINENATFGAELQRIITALSSSLSSHTANKSNPHGVTKAQIGLGNVDNTADANKSVKYAATAGSATKATQDGSGNTITSTYAAKTELIQIATETEAKAGTNNTKAITPLRMAQAMNDTKNEVATLKSNVSTLQSGQTAANNNITALQNGLAAAQEELDVIRDTAMNKNGIYRGKNLGTITASTIDAFITNHGIASGTFVDLYLGDYFTISDGTYNAQWMIAGFDTHYNKGDTALTSHHIAIIPRTILTTGAMNATDTTEGGYAGSQMHTTTLPSIVTKLQNALGSHLLKRRALLSTAVNTSKPSSGNPAANGCTSSWAWADVYATLMTEVEVYGTMVWSSSGYDVGEACMKLPVFNHINHVEFSRSGFWLRSVYYSTAFCGANTYGDANGWGASYSHGVRPLILLG